MSVQSTKRCFTCCRTMDGRTDAGELWGLHASVHRDLPGDGCYHCRHRQYRTAAAHVLLARANADAEEHSTWRSRSIRVGVVLCGRPSIREHSGAAAGRDALSLRCVCVGSRQAERRCLRCDANAMDAAATGRVRCLSLSLSSCVPVAVGVG